MRISSFIIGVLIIDIALHWYFWVRLFRDPGRSKRARVAGAAVLFGLALLFPLVRWISRGYSSPIFTALELVLFVWMGMALFITCVLVSFDLWRAISAGVKLARAAMRDMAPLPPPDPERRRLLAGTAATVAGVATTGLTAVSLHSGLSEVEVKEVGVELERLPAALDGLTLVQLTDVHVGMSTIDTRFIDQIVDSVNRLKADAVVITGDLVDGKVGILGPTVGLLAKLSSKYGTYFVHGNHEYYSDDEAWTQYLRKLGITVLRNSRVAVGDSNIGGASIDLAGIDDPSGARWNEAAGPDLKGALAGRDPERSLVLLAHQPKAIHQAATAGVELQLSGHTHGGQLFPFSHLVGLTQPYLAGLHTHGPGSQIYVSSGTGYWGPPMRLGAPAEITKIVLSRG